MTFVFLKAGGALATSSLPSLIEAGADLRVLLLMEGNSAFAQRKTATYLADITTLNEFNGGGYTPGGQALALQVLTEDADNDRYELTVSPNVWNPLSAGDDPIEGALVVNWVTDENDSEVVSYYDDGNFPATPNGGPFTVTWSAQGMIQFRCPLS